MTDPQYHVEMNAKCEDDAKVMAEEMAMEMGWIFHHNLTPTSGRRIHSPGSRRAAEDLFGLQK